MPRWPDVTTLLRPVFVTVACALALGAVPGATDPVAAQLRIEHENGRVDFHGSLFSGYVHRFELEDEESDARDRFFVRRARFKLSGDLWEVVTFRFDVDLLADDWDSFAKDIWIGVEPTRWLTFRLGQQKVPVSRNQLSGVTRQLFLSRPRLTDDLVPSRDIGLLATAHTPDDRLSGSIGVFTGHGPNQRRDDDEGLPLLAARVAWMPFAHVARGDGDVERTRRFALEVGLNGTISWDGEASDDETPLRTIDGRKILFGGDLTMKWQGLFLNAELLFAQFAPDAGASYMAGGYMVQASYYIPQARIEPAVRFDELNPDDRAEGNLERTLAVGLNAYPFADRRLRIWAEYTHHFPTSSSADEGWAADELTVALQLKWR